MKREDERLDRLSMETKEAKAPRLLFLHYRIIKMKTKSAYTSDSFT